MGKRFTVTSGLRKRTGDPKHRGHWAAGDTITDAKIEACGWHVEFLLANGAIEPCEDKPAPKKAESKPSGKLADLVKGGGDG